MCLHVPYKGSAPAVADLAGNVQAAFLVPGSVLPLLKAGKLKVLASTGKKRFAATPDTPTVIESGIRDFEEFAEYTRWETPRWAKVIKDIGAKGNQ
jgi:tripartite-type tricarboxylate transporter receptor subunit TctC